MPSSITTALPTPPANGFRPEFFQSYTPDPGPPVRAPGDENRPRTSYSAECHGSYPEFCAGEHFAQYREEMRENVDFLVALCQQLDMPDAAEVGQRFRIFYNHRFVQAFFDTHAELVDSAGKQSLDNFCAMLRDERLPADKRRGAIRNLSDRVTLCASGAVANLIAADRDLSLSAGGIRAKLWKVKEDVARNVLQQAMSERLGRIKDYPRNEIHYVNAAWNYMADAVGLNQIPDSMAPTLKPGFLVSCQESVIAALSPDKIAKVIAEECLAKFGSRAVLDPESSSGECTPEQVEWFFEILNDIRRDLGLTESELSMNSFVRLDDDGRRYHVRNEPSLIALELLKAMNAISLLANAPIHLGDGQDKDGEHIGLYSYGPDLVWRMRQTMSTDSAPSWEAHVDVDVIDADALPAWPGEPNTISPPAETIQRVLRSTDPADLMSVRANWLGTSQSILGLLKRLDHDRALQYLGTYLPYVLTGIPAEERSSFINEVIGLGEPGLALARAWYSDPWALLGERIGDKRVSRLECWMLADDASAIDAVRRIVSDSWASSHDPASLGGAINQGLGGVDGRSILSPVLIGSIFKAIARIDSKFLWKPVYRKSSNAVEALHRLLTDLLRQPTFREHVASGLPALLSGRKAKIVPVLHILYEGKGTAEMIESFHGLLLDPLILPHITSDLPTILLGERPDNQYPMWQALERKDASVMRAYGALLADLESVPGMEKWLPRLTEPDSSPASLSGQRLYKNALLEASKAGATDVIKAYHDVLVHPAVLPHIRAMLPDLLVGAMSPGRPMTPIELSDSLLNPRLPGYNAYFELITDPLLLPHILNGLPPDVLGRLPTAVRDKAIEAGILGADATVAIESASQTRPSIRGWIGSWFRRTGS